MLIYRFDLQVDKLEVVNKKWVRVKLLPGAPDSMVNISMID